MTSKAALKKLHDLLGEKLYEEITTQLAGSTVYFPSNADFADREERNIEIRDDFYSGKYEVPDLARKYNLSISRIYKIIQSRP